MTDPKHIAVVFKLIKINKRKAKQLRKGLEGLLDYAETYPNIMRSLYDQAVVESGRSGLMNYDEYVNFVREMLTATNIIIEEPQRWIRRNFSTKVYRTNKKK
jgi:hypothetical protein